MFWALIPILGCNAASLDFAVSAPLGTFSNRFGVDLQGDILIAASPAACSLPRVKPLYSCGPIWIGKLDASGKNLLFATYLGSGAPASVFTAVAGVAADAAGNIVVAAHTTAQDMPTVNAFQPSPKSPFTNLYLAKLAPDGSRLIYATYLGGSGGQTALSLAVDGPGAAYVAASVNSTDFPTTPQSIQYAGLYPTVVAKLGPDGALDYAARFAFEFSGAVKPIQIDATGRAVLVSNLEAAILAPDGSALIRATYPQWATLLNGCADDGTGDVWCAQTPFALPRSNGGLQFAGVASGGVPATANAFQFAGDTDSHLLIQGTQATATGPGLPISGFAVDPQNRNSIYAATAAGLYMSNDNGVSWSKLRDGPCLAIAVDPFDSNRLYLSLDAIPQIDPFPKIYRSTDGGATWTAILGGPSSGERILSLAADPNVRGLIYGAGPLLFRSTNGGDAWDSREVGPSRMDQSPSASTSTSSRSVQVDPTHPGWAYVTGVTSCIGFCGAVPALSRTEDGGNTWTDVNIAAAGNYGTSVSVTVDPASGDVVEIANGSALIFRGGNFASPQSLFSGRTTGIAFDPAQPGAVYLAVYNPQGHGSEYFLVESVDGGATWTALLPFDRPVYNLTISANSVLQASQIPDSAELYFLTSELNGNVSYGSYFGAAFTQVNAMQGSVAGFGTSAFVAGTTRGGLPLLNPVQAGVGGARDGFLTVFDDSGGILWSTYLGGSADDSIDQVLPLPDGSAVVVGTTLSSDFPSLEPSPLGSGTTFIAHLRP